MVQMMAGTRTSLVQSNWNTPENKRSQFLLLECKIMLRQDRIPTGIHGVEADRQKVVCHCRTSVIQ